MTSGGIDAAVQRALVELGSGDQDRLAVGGLPAQQLCERFGTPLYVFSAAVLRERVAAVRRALGPEVELLYSIKANPSVAVTACLREAGVGAEIASLGEWHVATAAGHASPTLRFAGPGKTDAELQHAVQHDVVLHVESAGELARLGALAAALGCRARFALRVNLPMELAGSRMRMGGASSRFGVDVAQVPAVLRNARRHPLLTCIGLHVYGGTQVFDAGGFVAHAERLLGLVADWQREFDVRFDEIDLGGGFGVATFAGDPEFDLDAAGTGLQALLAAHRQKGRRWFVELGRFLTAPAGIYLTRVLDVKDSGGQRHAVLDGGLHHAAAAAGFGAIVRRPPLLVHAGALRADCADKVTLGGPLCTPADQLAAALPLPELRPGDLIAVLHAGAYGLTYSPSLFLSHPSPAEVMVDAGEARIVRARGRADDALRGQQP